MYSAPSTRPLQTVTACPASTCRRAQDGRAAGPPSTRRSCTTRCPSSRLPPAISRFWLTMPFRQPPCRPLLRRQQASCSKSVKLFDVYKGKRASRTAKVCCILALHACARPHPYRRGVRQGDACRHLGTRNRVRRSAARLISKHRKGRLQPVSLLYFWCRHLFVPGMEKRFCSSFLSGNRLYFFRNLYYAVYIELYRQVRNGKETKYA